MRSISSITGSWVTLNKEAKGRLYLIFFIKWYFSKFFYTFREKITYKKTKEDKAKKDNISKKIFLKKRFNKNV